MKRKLEELFFYQHRYFLVFLLLALITAFVVFWGLGSFPAGLAPAEVASAVRSTSFSWPESIIGLPYNALQGLSVHVLGLSPFTLRLPSAILAFGSILVLGFALKNLIRTNTALITTLICVSSAFFLNFARLGAPMIMDVFLISLSLLFISNYVHKQHSNPIWLFLSAATLALESYQPLGICLFVLLFGAALIHPRGRILLTNLKISQILLFFITLGVLFAPIVAAISSQPVLILELLDAKELSFHWSDLWANAKALIVPWGTNTTWLATPLITIAELILLIGGVISLIKDRYAIRAIFLLTFSVLALGLALVDIERAYFFFVPFAFLMAFGVHEILRVWHELFPLNLAAQTLGYLPIAIFLGLLCASNISTFINSEFYQPSIAYEHDTTLPRVAEQINEFDGKKINLVVDDEQQNLYKILEKKSPNLTVSTKPAKAADVTIFTRPTFEQAQSKPTKAVTNQLSFDFDSVVLKIYYK